MNYECRGAYSYNAQTGADLLTPLFEYLKNNSDSDVYFTEIDDDTIIIEDAIGGSDGHIEYILNLFAISYEHGSSDPDEVRYVSAQGSTSTVLTHNGRIMVDGDDALASFENGQSAFFEAIRIERQFIDNCKREIAKVSLSKQQALINVLSADKSDEDVVIILNWLLEQLVLREILMADNNYKDSLVKAVTDSGAFFDETATQSAFKIILSHLLDASADLTIEQGEALMAFVQKRPLNTPSGYKI